MIRKYLIPVFVVWAGFFDYMMDAIKDFGQSDKFWFWKMVKGTSHQLWGTYGGHVALWGAYNPAYPWSSDAWHMMKHGLLLCWSGAVSVGVTLWFDFLYDSKYNKKLQWYWLLVTQIAIWWLLYWIEGVVFNLGYQPLK